LITPDTRPVIERLWQLYMHDLSEFRGTMPGEDGMFLLRRLNPAFDDPDRRIYLVYRESRPAGFAIVTGVREQPRTIGEFFVVRAARRHQVGHEVALELLQRHPGRWEIAFQEANAGAAKFWRRVATAAVGTAWQEELRPVPGTTCGSPLTRKGNRQRVS
jgi:predicted acetyltransferase